VLQKRGRAAQLTLKKRARGRSTARGARGQGIAELTLGLEGNANVNKII